MTIELDKAGRESAIAAANEIAVDGAPVPDYVDAVIRAYLEATHPPAQGDYAELVDRTMGSIVTDCEKQKIFLGTVNAREIIHKHVATAITSLSAELAKVKAERDELDALYHEGGTWEQQLARAESERDEANARAERAESALAEKDKALDEISGIGFDAPRTFAGDEAAWSHRRANIMQQIARRARNAGGSNDA